VTRNENSVQLLSFAPENFGVWSNSVQLEGGHCRVGYFGVWSSGVFCHKRVKFVCDPGLVTACQKFAAPWRCCYRPLVWSERVGVWRRSTIALDLSWDAWWGTPRQHLLIIRGYVPIWLVATACQDTIAAAPQLVASNSSATS
jgi:hypothetical protein